jgi:hypothetical protein
MVDARGPEQQPGCGTYSNEASFGVAEFATGCGRPLLPWPTGELVRRCWPRKRKFDPVYYRRVRAAAAEIADIVGHEHRGRCSSSPGGLLWKLREPIE